MIAAKNKISRAATLSRRILDAVLSEGVSQSQLASRLGVHRAQVSRVKRGSQEFTDAQLEDIERMMDKPLWLVLLGAEPSAGASSAARKLHADAIRVLERTDLLLSAKVRGAQRRKAS